MSSLLCDIGSSLEEAKSVAVRSQGSESCFVPCDCESALRDPWSKTKRLEAAQEFFTQLEIRDKGMTIGFLCVAVCVVPTLPILNW